MDGKTHFADDDTIRYIAKLQRERDTAMDERIAAGKRIEELERQRDELETECAVHAACTKARVEQLAAVIAERDALIADAERYRKLRRTKAAPCDFDLSVDAMKEATP